MIVVTATHRSESAQKVPIPISVLSGATLADTGTLNVAQVVQLQPSLAYYGTNPRNASINIRGLGAPLGLTNDGLEQGVGVYVDQVYYSRVANAVNDLYDVSRVEVLRGPKARSTARTPPPARSTSSPTRPPSTPRNTSS